MKTRKIRKPDFLFVLAVLVFIGVVITMKVQASLPSESIAKTNSETPLTTPVKVATLHSASK